MNKIHNTKFEKQMRCPNCGEKYIVSSLGMCSCPSCGFEEPDDFGKVREYIDTHGTATAMEISRETGVPMRRITEYLRKGKLEIPEGSSSFIHCQKCGVDLRFGRFCPSCASQICQQLEQALDVTEVGAVPKKMHGAMQFLDKHR